jgi:hypothetical protein
MTLKQRRPAGHEVAPLAASTSMARAPMTERSDAGGEKAPRRPDKIRQPAGRVVTGNSLSTHEGTPAQDALRSERMLSG